MHKIIKAERDGALLVLHVEIEGGDPPEVREYRYPADPPPMHQGGPVMSEEDWHARIRTELARLLELEHAPAVQDVPALVGTL